jgi:hypothetical protein
MPRPKGYRCSAAVRAKMMAAFTPEMATAIVDGLRRRRCLAFIAEDVGVAYSTLRRYLGAHGLRRPVA